MNVPRVSNSTIGTTGQQYMGISGYQDNIRISGYQSGYQDIKYQDSIVQGRSRAYSCLTQEEKSPMS